MRNIAIIDSNKDFRELIRKMIDSFPSLSNVDYRIYAYNCADEFLKYLNQIPMDIILLDIEMPVTNGLETAEILRYSKNQAIIIFITSDIDDMKDAFGLNVYGFIDKHEFMTSFPSVFLNCNEYLERNIYLLFKTNTGNLKVRKNDIIYASFEKRKVALYTKKEKIYVNLVSLTKFFDLVKSCGNFIYINRSTVINLHYLTSISNYEANLSGILYPILISKEKYKEVTIRFMNTLPYNNY